MQTVRIVRRSPWGNLRIAPIEEFRLMHWEADRTEWKALEYSLTNRINAAHCSSMNSDAICFKLKPSTLAVETVGNLETESSIIADEPNSNQLQARSNGAANCSAISACLQEHYLLNNIVLNSIERFEFESVSNSNRSQIASSSQPARSFPRSLGIQRIAELHRKPELSFQFHFKFNLIEIKISRLLLTTPCDRRSRWREKSLQSVCVCFTNELSKADSFAFDRVQWSCSLRIYRLFWICIRVRLVFFIKFLDFIKFSNCSCPCVRSVADDCPRILEQL